VGIFISLLYEQLALVLSQFASQIPDPASPNGTFRKETGMHGACAFIITPVNDAVNITHTALHCNALGFRKPTACSHIPAI
jgi:hypothetical protein